MKNPRTGLFLIIMASSIMILIPCQAMAQDTNPPPCCDKVPPPGPNSAVGAGTQGQVTMPDSVLLAMGLTRSQFLDRLTAGLFSDKEISLIFSVTTTISVPADASATNPSPELVTVTYQYRIPRSQMKAEVIDGLDQFVITDGVTYIQINFTPSQSPATLQ
jgi:hypothetical protein